MQKFRLALIAVGFLSVTCSSVAGQERLTPRLSDERARAMVRAMDRDGDGLVTRNEFSDAISEGEASSADTSSTGLWKALDSNRDGVLDVSEIKANLRLPYTIH